MNPLEIVVAPDAKAEIRAVQVWLHTLDPSSERRFSQRLANLLEKLAKTLPSKIATGRPPQLDTKASEGMIRPVFQERFYTSKQKPPRRSNTSTWRIFYALLDQDGDRQPEVLQVLHIFHAAAELPWDRLESLGVETDND